LSRATTWLNHAGGFARPRDSTGGLPGPARTQATVRPHTLARTRGAHLGGGVQARKPRALLALALARKSVLKASAAEDCDDASQHVGAVHVWLDSRLRRGPATFVAQLQNAPDGRFRQAHLLPHVAPAQPLLTQLHRLVR